jgi:transposase
VATRRHFTQEYKDQAVSLVLDSGRTIAEVAKSIGVHEMTLGKWVKKAREAGRVPDSDLSEPERAELRECRSTIRDRVRPFSRSTPAGVSPSALSPAPSSMRRACLEAAIRASATVWRD